jgi:hypothetical protein
MNGPLVWCAAGGAPGPPESSARGGRSGGEQWREAHSQLNAAYEAGSELEILTALDATIRAYKILIDSTGGAASRSAMPIDAFDFPMLRDGLTDGEALYAVRWHGATLGELKLTLEPLLDAISEGAAWIFMPSLPVAVVGEAILKVGPEAVPVAGTDDLPPVEDSLITRLQAIVSDVSIEHGKLEAACCCLEQLRLGAAVGASRWLRAIQGGRRLTDDPACDALWSDVRS